MNCETIAKKVTRYADEFALSAQQYKLNLDFTARSLLEDIDMLIPVLISETAKNGITPELCRLESNILAYIIRAICIVHGAQCIGEFDPDDSLLGHYYNLEIHIHGEVVNIANGLLRAKEGEFSFKKFYSTYVVGRAFKNS